MKSAFHPAFSRSLHAANLAIVLGAPAVYLALRSRLPDRVPVHLGLDGRPDRHGSPDELWGLFAIMAVLYLVLWASSYAIARERRPAPPGAPERYAPLEEARRRAQVRVAEGSMLVANATLASVALSIVAGSLPGNEWLLARAPVAVGAVASIGLAAVLGHWLPRLSRIQAELRALGIPLAGRPESWRWGGLVYFAREDPAVFVPKRTGVGLTLNFARRGAWWFLAAALGVPLLVATLAGALAK